MARSRDELVTAIHMQLKAIKASSAAFDSGEDWEVMRLATAACVLLYDGKRDTA